VASFCGKRFFGRLPILGIVRIWHSIWPKSLFSSGGVSHTSVQREQYDNFQTFSSSFSLDICAGCSAFRQLSALRREYQSLREDFSNVQILLSAIQG
jgi:hypothetical protein